MYNAFLKDNLPRIKFKAYGINLDVKQNKETYWVSLCVDRNVTIYFNYFGI